MAIRNPKSRPLHQGATAQTQADGLICTRDRLLAALQAASRLSRSDTEAINRVVREAREASLADELSA